MGLDTFRQIQGASVGSPPAPVLLCVGCSGTEYMTIKSFRAQLTDAGLLHSFIMRRSELQTYRTKLMFQLDFYGLPIEMEHVPGEELLGSITSTVQGR